MTDVFHTLRSGWNIHVNEQGDGRPVVLLHGNPTWSYMYRDLSARLASSGFRAMAPDHLGCGLSDKPQDARYCLQTHLDNLEELMDARISDGTPCDFVLHDWGGPIGIAYALRHPERVRRMVLMNTIAWPSRQFPKAIYLTKCPWLGALLVRRLNVLLWIALRRVPSKPFPAGVAAAYRRPYGDYASRIAIQRFPQDIPLGPRHPSYGLFTQMAAGLGSLSAHRILFCWGGKDRCFPQSFLQRWREILPDAQVRLFPEASHFLLEDDPEHVIPAITDFLTGEE